MIYKKKEIINGEVEEKGRNGEEINEKIEEKKMEVKVRIKKIKDGRI